MLVGTPATILPSRAVAAAGSFHPRRAAASPPLRVYCRAVAATGGSKDCFHVAVDLGGGGGLVTHDIVPFFSDSELVTVRMPVPFDLHAEATRGVLRVSALGDGLRAGDVLRACTTFRAKMKDAWLGLLPVRATPPPGPSR